MEETGISRFTNTMNPNITTELRTLRGLVLPGVAVNPSSFVSWVASEILGKNTFFHFAAVASPCPASRDGERTVLRFLKFCVIVNMEKWRSEYELGTPGSAALPRGTTSKSK